MQMDAASVAEPIEWDRGAVAARAENPGIEPGSTGPAEIRAGSLEARSQTATTSGATGFTAVTRPVDRRDLGHVLDRNRHVGNDRGIDRPSSSRIAVAEELAFDDAHAAASRNDRTRQSCGIWIAVHERGIEQHVAARGR